MSRQREVEILQAMAKADLPEQRRLAQELEDLRATRTASLQGERDLDLASTVIRDTLTPVRVHERHTASTDWITEVPTVVEGSYDNEMRTEATLWFQRLHEAVREDREEFGEQAQGMARRVAGKFGEAAPAAAQVFLDTAARLHAQASDQNGNAESQITDYETKADQDPLFAEDWEGEEAEGVHPPMPGAGESTGQGYHGNGSSLAARWYEPGYTLSDECQDDGVGCDGTDCDCSCHSETGPAFENNEEVAEYHKTSALQSGYKASRKTASPKSGDKDVCHADGKPIEFFAGEWMHLKGGPSHNDVYPATPKEKAEKESSRKTAKRCPACEGGGVFADSLCYVCGGDGQVEASKTASEGQTCATCGDKIAKDPAGENPSTWHHDNGEKHDHEAKPSGSKESSLQVTASRPIYEIAADIRREWGPSNVNYAAKPYLDAMLQLSDMNSRFYEDDAKTILAYFLSNAGSFRGGRAKELKDEIKVLLGRKVSGRGDNTFSLSDAKNEDGEWTMSPEQIRAEMDISEPSPDDEHDDYGRWASRRQAGNPNGPKTDDGGAESSLPDVEVGDENDRPMWPWELAEGDPATGEGASNVANVPTPGGESGYPQPKKSSLDLPLPAQGRVTDFRSRVQAGLARMEESQRDPFVREASSGWIDAARQVVETHGFVSVNPESGEVVETKWRGDEVSPSSKGIVLDLFSASALVQVYDALGPENKAKFAAMPLPQAVEVAFKIINQQR